MHARAWTLVIASIAAAIAASVATVAASIVVAGPPGLAGPNDFRLDVRASRFEPGDVVTRTVKFSAEQSIVAKAPDGKVLAEDHEDFTLTYKAVVRITQVTSEGRPWRADVHFAEFVRDDGKAADECLKGMTFEWVDARVRRIAGAAKVSPKVQRWLDEEFSWGLSADMKYDRVAALRPKAPVAVGASWDGDGATIADHYAAWNPVLVGAKAATVRCTLQSVTPLAKPSSATIRFEAVVPIVGQVRHETRERTDLGPGSDVRFTETASLRLDARIHTGTSTCAQTTTIHRDSADAKVAAIQKLVTETTVALGGDFPAIPPAKGR